MTKFEKLVLIGLFLILGGLVNLIQYLIVSDPDTIKWLNQVAAFYDDVTRAIQT